MTGFEARQITQNIRIDRCDGVQMCAALPKGWEGSFELDRGGRAVDDFIAGLEAGWYSGSGVQPGMIYQFVNDPGGAVSTYQFDGAVFALHSSGKWRISDSVRQRLEFCASKRLSI